MRYEIYIIENHNMVKIRHMQASNLLGVAVLVGCGLAVVGACGVVVVVG